ncbi:FMRFamide neuropeptides isoform X2 [Anopheles darlingi]|nr:FMRFamide neuropeptides isoform X2 [Anopheles darlingi]
MKLYLFLAIVVCKSCRADYDSSLLESTDPRSELLRYAPFMAGELAMWPSLTAGDVPGDGAGSSSAEVMSEFEWSPYQPRAPWSMMVKRSGAKADIQTRRRSALDKNFMRFGRAGSNLMRFGRPDRNFLRFGRDPSADLEQAAAAAVTDLSKEYATSTEQLDGSDAEQQQQQQQQPTVKRNAAGNTEEVLGGGGVMMFDSGEQLKPKQVVYYRRDSPKNLMRFGKRRSTGSGYLRFGRAGNLMRFGRSDEPAGTYGRTARANLMRFGRAGNLMRFGRSERPQSSSNTTGMPPADSQPDARPKPSIRQSAATIPTNLIELFDALPSNTVAAGDEDDRLAMYVVEK